MAQHSESPTLASLDKLTSHFAMTRRTSSSRSTTAKTTTTTTSSTPAKTEPKTQKVTDTTPANIEKTTPSSEPTAPAEKAEPVKIQTDVREKLAKKDVDNNVFVPSNPAALEKAAEAIASDQGFELNRGTSIGARLMARARKDV